MVVNQWYNYIMYGIILTMVMNTVVYLDRYYVFLCMAY